MKRDGRRRVRGAVRGEGRREAGKGYVCPAKLGRGCRGEEEGYQGHIVSRVKVMVES